MLLVPLLLSLAAAEPPPPSRAEVRQARAEVRIVRVEPLVWGRQPASGALLRDARITDGQNGTRPAKLIEFY
jgi:hypothetical protein